MSQTAVSTPIDLAATVRFASNNKLVLPACSGFQKAIHGNAVLLPLLLAKGGCTPEEYASGVMAGQTTHNRRSSPLRTRKYRRYGDGRDYSNRDGHVQRLFPVSGGNTTIHANEYFDLEGGETFSSNAVDGDTIYVQIYNSSGALLSTWSSFVNNGQTLQNCWVGGGQLLCGSNAIDVLWYIQLQCNDGAFTMKFYCSNVEFAEGTFTSLPQIEESRVQTYNQVPYAGAGYEYHHECRFVDQNGNIINPREKHTCSDPLAANEKPYYIKAKGCFLSDSANLLTYHGVTVDPPTLNTALNGLRGGYINYNVSPDGLHTYSVQNGGNMSFVRRDRNLAQDICTYGPQIMGVHCTTDSRTGRQNPGHWVTVYGQPTDKSTWLIHDPNGGVSSTLAARYPAGYCASIVLVLEIVCLSLIAFRPAAGRCDRIEAGIGCHKAEAGNGHTIAGTGLDDYRVRDIRFHATAEKNCQTRGN